MYSWRCRVHPKDVGRRHLAWLLQVQLAHFTLLQRELPLLAILLLLLLAAHHDRQLLVTS
jgi:hypothetical protein